MFSKKNIFKLNWMKKRRHLYRVRKNFNFSLTLRFSKSSKKKLLNKLIKSKRLCGLFKRKLNFRNTLLRKRSFLYFFLEKKIDKKRFFRKRRRRIFRFRWFRRGFRYRIINIDLSRSFKKTFFENRLILKQFFKKKNLNRQYKTSHFLKNYLNKDSKNLINLFEYKLINILVKSHIFNNKDDALFFLKKGFVLVNNSVEVDPSFIVNCGDIIKINSKKNYYFFYRKSLVKAIKMSKKLNWAFYKFIKKRRKNFLFPKVYNWIDSSLHFGLDIPRNIEVDFVNMTVCILSKVFDLKTVSYSTVKYINFYLLRLYNWNYIV